MRVSSVSGTILSIPSMEKCVNGKVSIIGTLTLFFRNNLLKTFLKIKKVK